MLKQKKWFVFFAVFLLGLAIEVRTVNAAACEEVVTNETTVEELNVICAEDIWKEVYRELMYGTEMNAQKLAALAMVEVKSRDLELMTSATDHIVNYHGRRFAITDDEYQVLLKIVESEAPDEDIEGKLLVANVVLNRLEIGFGGNTISEVVFAKGQFEPAGNGAIFKAVPTEETIEAVERALDGEDISQGALYFVARAKASKKGIRWFDKNLQFLFKHGNHEFFTEKDR